jgi:sulfite exporter TauE/SafE
MDSPQSLAAAFILGLFSTVHCIGMCGGIIGALSLSLPEDIRQRRQRHVFFISLYNLGRILSYSFAGLVVGYIGAEAAAYTDMSGGPSILRHTGAVLMIAIGLYLAGWLPQLSKIERIGAPLWKLLEPIGRKLVPVTTMPRALLYGLVWGWLPCGMVYFVLVWALTSGSATQGALTMAAFGLGTLPALLTTGLAVSSLKRFTRMKTVRQLVGILVIAMAIGSLLMPMGGHKHDHADSNHTDHQHANQQMKP